VVSGAEQLSNRQDQNGAERCTEVKQYSETKTEVDEDRDPGVNRTVSEKAHV